MTQIEGYRPGSIQRSNEYQRTEFRGAGHLPVLGGDCHIWLCNFHVR